MLKKLLIIMMMTLFSIQLLDVQANTNALSQLPEAIQQRLYERLNNQEDDAIEETQLITASDGALFDYFGFSVSIDGTTLAVGAYRKDDWMGSVYVYDLTKNSEDAGFERKITASDGAAYDFFGHSVAIDGTTLLVSSIGDNDYRGTIYVYDLTKNSGEEGFEHKITASDGSKQDYFGINFDLFGTTLVVSSYLDDDNGLESGSVYVYDLTKTSGDDGFERKITASDGAAGDRFGESVAIYKNTLVVGSILDDDNVINSGSVYVYDLTKNSGDTGFERKITASDGAELDRFGRSVLINGTTLVVSAFLDDDNGTNSGSLYVYDLTKTSGDDGFERKITASDGELGDFFGLRIDMIGNTLVVSAQYDDDNGGDSGSVYIYDLTKNSGEEGFERKITASDGAESDQFGHSVAIDENRLVVGALLKDNELSSDVGAVYVFNGTFGSGNTKTDEEWASEITTMIDALLSPYVRADVEAARDAYDALTPEQQALITEETYQTLLDAEQALADIDAAAAVDAMIEALTDPYDIDAIDAARDAYENLTEAQKELVELLPDLEEAEQRYADIDAASIVEGMIDALSEPYDAVAVYDARLAYDALTETQLALITPETYQKLLDAEQALADINAAAAVDALIELLTSPYVRADVEAARAAYENLTEAQKELVELLPDLEAAEVGLVDQALAQAVELLINTLITPYDSDAVQTARDAYDALTEAQQALVTNYQALIDAEQAIDDQAAAAAVDELIDALSEPYDPQSVQAAREAYENLTEDQQILVTGILDLENAEDTLMNETEAAGVDALIQTLTEESTEEEVDAVREAYESLTEEQQALVTQLPTLITYEQQFASPDSTGLVFFMIFFIGVISAVIYFAFYKRNKEKDEKKINE